jgi:uncharacterized small protein (DUF1192 family)
MGMNKCQELLVNELSEKVQALEEEIDELKVRNAGLKAENDTLIGVVPTEEVFNGL